MRCDELEDAGVWEAFTRSFGSKDMMRWERILKRSAFNSSAFKVWRLMSVIKAVISVPELCFWVGQGNDRHVVIHPAARIWGIVRRWLPKTLS